MSRIDHRNSSFVLRIWWEQEGEGGFWRGWVQHAASGESCYFDQVVGLLNFVEMHAGPLKWSVVTGRENVKGGEIR